MARDNDIFSETDEAPSRPDIRSDQRLDLRDDLRAPQGLKRRMESTQDKYGVPAHVIDYFKGLGWELEWKRHSIQGQPEEFYETDLRQNYWEPVLCEKYPGKLEAMVPYGLKSGPIRKSDLMLMMRPSYLCDDARIEQRRVTDERLQAHRKMIAGAPAGAVPFKPVADRAPIQKAEYERVK